MTPFKDNFIRSRGQGKTWSCEIISSVKRPVESYFQEICNLSEEIYSTRRGKIYLMYSGGVDSQYIFNVFHRLGFDFVPVIVKLTNGSSLIYNHHDIKYAFDSCEEKNINPTIIDIDFDQFVKSGKINEIAEESQCSSYALPATAYAMTKLDGYVISSNEPTLRYNKLKNSWELDEDEFMHAFGHYTCKKIEQCIPFMLSYTPEIMLSFLLDPVMQDLCNNKIPGKLSSHSSKSHVYNNGSGFNLPVYNFVSKERVKYTGYEEIYKSSIFSHPNLRMFEYYRDCWGGNYKEDYTSVIKKLKGKIYE